MPRFWKGQPLDSSTMKPTGKVLLTAPSLPKIKEEISAWAKKAGEAGVVHVCRVDTGKASIEVLCAIAARRFTKKLSDGSQFALEQEATFQVSAEGVVSTYKAGKVSKAPKAAAEPETSEKPAGKKEKAAILESLLAKKKLTPPADVKPKKPKK